VQIIIKATSAQRHWIKMKQKKIYVMLFVKFTSQKLHSFNNSPFF